MQVKRIYVEKKEDFNIEAKGLYDDLRINLGIEGLKGVRIVNRYDVEGMSDDEYLAARDIVFCEPPVDRLYEEDLPIDPGHLVFAIEYLPGQYDQRADSAAQCVQIITHKDKPVVKAAKLIILEGDISQEEFQKIKNYCINPIESREASLDKPESLQMSYSIPEDVQILRGFTAKGSEELKLFWKDMGFAMTLADLQFCQEYFRDAEHRDPTLTELKVIDTYWSDHCRHTTFLTGIKNIKIEQGKYSNVLESAYNLYKQARNEVYGDKPKKECLMDIATIAMKKMKKQGLLNDLDESDEINACSIKVNVDVDGEQQEWLVMFKNETHNHPTEIEPFGGAATCLGGAIRDPLSSRSYVYQAMRVTGSGDPRTPVEETIAGKLPQRKITTGAAAGYSSYGNQIGLSTGQVAEIYHPGYVAKRMEIGAVIGAAPRENVIRSKPQPGDLVILLGGQTGRDGCGGATGSSKAHDEGSLYSCGAEVQKGNPPTERKIQRLFRNPHVTRMIKKCNDFGAGGVSVAIGELAPGLEINLDVIPKKYEGLDGTELAISESQERMAVVLSPENSDAFIRAAKEENLEATVVAQVTDTNRLRMKWRGKYIVDISRDFLDTNGVEQYTDVYVESPAEDKNYFRLQRSKNCSLKDRWIANLESLNVCSQRGLVERFDSTIGAGTVIMPLGGRYQLTPAEGMAAKVPVLCGETNTATLMTYGFNPEISEWSPFHGAIYAIVEAAAKITAMGGDYKTIRLTLQEYFERLEKDPKKWGKPFAALLGALYVQDVLGIPAIGGKDSMSGTFENLSVPPTLAAFAVSTVNAAHVLSPEFKSTDSSVVLVPLNRDEYDLPDFKQLEKNYACIRKLVLDGKIKAAHSVRYGGLAEAISKMCFGNRIGFSFEPIDEDDLFKPLYGSILLEISKYEDLSALFGEVEHKLIGYTQENEAISINGVEISLDEALQAWESPLESIFPSYVRAKDQMPAVISCDKRNKQRPKASIASPRVFIPVFPGTNCEYDTARAFEKAGGRPDIMVIRNLTSSEIDDSLREMADRIRKAQILMIPGGFSGGDEPDGSGKFIAAAFRNPAVKDAVMDLIKNRDGLILGICNGFQALIKLGLVPYGEIRDLESDSPTLTFNTIGRHVSRMVQTRVSSVLSPWLALCNVGDIHTIPVSHGEGRFVASREIIDKLASNGQIATQYVDLEGNPTMEYPYNPNGSVYAVEGITSPDGRIFGKMGHSERIGSNVIKNIPGLKDQLIFQSGVRYFK
ncbi:MAG TPA: phosphoribosylformylglycinamidine synthase [Clostridiales bacterium]|nr:phosphoribosylformylglycinamidine synthase [Clostridiales bacterium]